MLPRVPPELVARLVGIVLVGVCIGSSVRLAADIAYFAEWPATPAGSTSGAALGWLILVLDGVTWRGALRLLADEGYPVLGLLLGGYFLLGGVWPIRGFVAREVRRG